MKKSALLLLSSFVFFTATSVEAQRGSSGRHDVHRSLHQLETEYLNCLAQQEQIYSEIEQRNADLEKIHPEHNKAEGRDKTRFSQQIDRINNANRAANIAIARINLELQRIKLGIDRLTRHDQHLSNNDEHGSKRLRVKAIQNLTFKREGPVRQNGRLGFVDTNVWEITFNDNSKQKLEEKSFTPIR